ncbi:MAG: T9SS type A sorting domain-containing protein [Bacteroidota bacterium]
MRLNFLLASFLIASVAFGQGTGEVIITEYHNRPLKPSQEQLDAALPNNPGGADTSPNEGHTEWFEIYNTTNQDVVMDGWTLTDASSSSNVSTITSFTLPANSYAVFSGFNIPEGQGGIVFDYFYDYKKPSFNNESSYADAGDTSCPDGVIIEKADGTLVDEVRYDYGYGEYIGNMDASSSCNMNASAVGIPPQGSSSKTSFMLIADPSVMNSTDNDLAENWVFSTLVYDEEGNQKGTPGLPNDATTVSVENIFDAGVKVYPNPAADFINVESTVQQPTSVEIYNILGKLMTNVVSMDNNRFDVSELEFGMYIIKVNFDNESVIRKVMIQK